MASKLFHSVVAVGISLGGAACGGHVDGAVEEPPDDAGPLLDAGKPLPDAAKPLPDAGVVPEAGLKPDASIAPDAPHQDAGAPDAPKDAIIEAFCDVAWPITKSGREVCGPYDACALLEAPYCYGPDGAGNCKLYPLQCVGNEWHCMGGAAPSKDFQAPEPCE